MRFRATLNFRKFKEPLKTALFRTTTKKRLQPQPKTIDLNTRLWGINTEFAGLFPRSTLRRRNLKTEVSLWKRIKCSPFALRRRNLKTEVSLWERIKCFPFPLYRRKLKTEVSLWKRIKCFQSTLLRRNLKTQQPLANLDLCLRKIWQEKSRDYPATRTLISSFTSA